MSTLHHTEEFVRPAERWKFQSTPAIARIQGEVVRKSLHLLIAIVPLLASINVLATLSVLAAGTIFYAFAEASRLRGRPILVVSDLTLIASREKDRHGFILGPVTLSLGAMLSLLLYPLPAASIAIYALAFGDGLASLAGTIFRGPSVPLLRGKTMAGSFACFAAVFLVTLQITNEPSAALVLAGTATFLEAIPAGNFDNIVIPFGVGLTAWALHVG
jgi:dolichol kinase